MRCVLCHGKISPFRRWAKESEFCSAEHAEAYRNQTLSRLMGGEDAGDAERPPLPFDDLVAPPKHDPKYRRLRLR